MILKAGCILMDTKNKKVGIVYRKEYDDYSFPKGHLEKNETFMDCAIRETEEETKRIPLILDEKEICIEKYKDSRGYLCEVHYFIAKDNGHSDNSSLEVHDLLWIDTYEVENILTHEHTKDIWNKVKKIVIKYMENA